MTLRRALAALLLIFAGILVTTGPARSAAAAPAVLAAVLAADDDVEPGEAARITGQLDKAPAGGAVKLQLTRADGRVLGPLGPFPVGADRRVTAEIPASALSGVRPGRETGFREVLAIDALPADATATTRSDDPSGRLLVTAAPTELQLENEFVSSVGWVKPGATYPTTVRVLNYQSTARPGGTATIDAPDGASFVSANGATVTPSRITWSVGDVPAATTSGTELEPGVKELVVEAKAKSTREDRTIVWKDLSSTAALGSATASSHGPKVIPPKESFDTARYGDRPFPVVPVDFSDRRHDATTSTAAKLAQKINDPDTPGSTRNLYQEMSYGQLFPQADIPSDGIASAPWGDTPFSFTRTVPGGTCQAPSLADLPNDGYKTVVPERIRDGWYQLPGPTGYYGSDANGSAVIGSLTGVGALQNIDAGCGPTAKAVYDAAQIADPEIDYNDFDTDKDGVVDFFMMVFAGLGGNGESQLRGTPPYDNIWPHSASLENAYTDPATGLKGYVTKDRLRDLEGRLQFYTDASYSKLTSTPTDYPAFVRVGPYNVNPESAIAKASVISHEYGHSLGLPDFYSTGSRETYGTWTLMAEDHSQNMDVYARQELGWLVPRVLQPGTTEAKDIRQSKEDVHRIDWQDAAGRPYSLTGPGVHNGEAYVAKLPARQVIDPKSVPSGSHVWWSQAGNDYGCPPAKGHNLDIALPQLKDVPAGTRLTLSFRSSFEIEWDFDYGFVMTTTDGGQTYTSVASQKGYTTASTNPNSSDCQGKYGNGLTGSSGIDYTNPVALQTARTLGDYGSGHPFVDDAYDVSALAGKGGAIRFAYATDPGAAKAGWFIDDIVVKAGDRVVYSSDVEDPTDPAVYNGGCRESLQTAKVCTKGWQYTSALDGSPADHAYYMELRDRSSFDFDGRGEDDRGNGPTFGAGLSLVYTDENHGLGNVGTDDPPAQTPVDARPEPGSATPDLDDAAFTADAGRSAYSDSGAGYADNYSDPASADGTWRHAFDCLSFDVQRMSGTDAAAASNLTGDVRFTLTGRCGTYDYGYTAADAGGPADGGGAGTGAGAGSGGAAPPATSAAPPVSGASADGTCVVTQGFGRASVAPRGSGLRFDLTRRVPAKATVEVFSQSSGRTVRNRRIARFTGRAGAFTWNGRAGGRAVANGLYLIRVAVALPGGGSDVRRFVVERRGGRFILRASTSRRPTCSLLREATLSSSAFGGRTGRRLGIAYRLGRDAQVTVSVLRGRKVVRRLTTGRTQTAGAQRLSLRPNGLRRGEHSMVLQAKAGTTVERVILRSRRL